MSDWPSEIARTMRQAEDARRATEAKARTSQDSLQDSLEAFVRNLTAGRIVQDELDRIARQTRRGGT